MRQHANWKKLGIGGLLLLLFSCGDPPDITKNTNPFPNPTSFTVSTRERFTLDTWLWSPLPLSQVKDVAQQNQANEIFDGVEIEFFNPGTGTDTGLFEYTNNDGAILEGGWELDLEHQILTMSFIQRWDSPILTQTNKIIFDVVEISENRLEMRLTEVFELKSAILVFTH